MVRRNCPYLACHAWFLFIAAAATLFSNPIMLPESPPITEIQATTPKQWTIEVDLGNLYFNKSKTSYSTDTIMLDCISSSLPTSDVSMRECAIKEIVDTNNIVLLTEKHFPGLQIQTGKTVYLSLKGQDRKWTTYIYQTLSSPGTSLKFMNPKAQEYVVSACPSLGTRNSNEPMGQVTGTVRDKNLNLVGGLLISCSPNPTQYVYLSRLRTNSAGYFETGMLDTCHTYSLSFLNDSNKQISNTVVGPLKIKPRTLIQRDIVLDDYTIPPVGALRPGPGLKSTPLVRFLPADMSTRQIVIAISGSSPSQKGKLDIYSMNGLHIRSLAFACTGTGTYTIPWDGSNKKNRQAPGGSYVCRVTIGNEVLCKGIITK